jgi:HSP20 family protein
MFGMPRWTSFDDVFNLHREVDRLFNQAWSDMPLRSVVNASPSFPFTVRSSEEGWRIDVPLAGVDPKDVRLEAAGNQLTIRVESQGSEKDAPATRYEQTVTVPQFADLEKLSATHRHGMLTLTLPIKDSVKPRRIEIQAHDEQKQLTGAGR